MSKCWFLMVILLMVALPSVLHAIMIGKIVDEVYLQTETVGKVLFSHSVHGTECKMCHPQLFIKKSNGNHVSMKAIEEGKFCGACHNGEKAFSVSGNCLTCHDVGDILFKDKDAGDVTFPHSSHIEMFSCDECHPDLFKAERGANKATMEDMENGEFCGACHDGDTAFNVAEDCDSCHDM